MRVRAQVDAQRQARVFPSPVGCRKTRRRASLPIERKQTFGEKEGSKDGARFGGGANPNTECVILGRCRCPRRVSTINNGRSDGEQQANECRRGGNPPPRRVPEFQDGTVP